MWPSAGVTICSGYDRAAIAARHPGLGLDQAMTGDSRWVVAMRTKTMVAELDSTNP